MTLLRPRDRKWTAGKTCKGCGRHGKGGWEEGMLLETLEETGIVDDGVDASDEAIGRLAASVGDEVVDQEVERLPLKDRHPRWRQ